METRSLVFRHQFLLGIFSIVMFLAGCNSIATPTSTPNMMSPTIASIDSATELSPETIATSTASPILSTTIVSPTFTVVPPTPMPIPTLTANERQTLARQMLETNGGCELPCWWGITPSKTDWQSVLKQCKNYGGCDLDIPESAQVPDYAIRQRFDQLDGKVRSILVTSEVPGQRLSGSFSKDWQRYALDQVLTRYGKPSQVFVELSNYCADSPCAPSGYGLYVVYDDLGILFRYLGPAERSDPIQACPVFAKISYLQLVLQSPQDTRTLMQTSAIDPDQIKWIRPLTEVAEMTIEDFYRIFKEPDSKECITSPAKFWP